MNHYRDTNITCMKIV